MWQIYLVDMLRSSLPYVSIILFISSILSLVGMAFTIGGTFDSSMTEDMKRVFKNLFLYGSFVSVALYSITFITPSKNAYIMMLEVYIAENPSSGEIVEKYIKRIEGKEED